MPWQDEVNCMCIKDGVQKRDGSQIIVVVKLV